LTQTLSIEAAWTVLVPAQRYYACQVQNLGPGTLYICANLADVYQTPDYYEALIDGSDTAVYTLFGAQIKNVYFKSFSTSTIRFGWASAVAGQPPVGVVKDLFDVADFEPIPFSRGEGTGAAVWGSITGNLQDQADLESVLVSLAPLNNPVFTGMATTPALRVTTGAAPGNVLTDIDGLGTAAWLPGGGGPGAAVWGSITGTLSNQTDLAMALAAKEPAITSGTTAQYWRGDKTWQTLNASAVGLGNVLNQTQITGATNSTLTQTGTTLSINLANANTWTTMQTFSGGLTGVLTGTATGNMPLVGPGNAGNVLTSTGSAWISAAPTVYVPLTLTAPSASTIPLTVKGASGQTADLQQWQDNTGAVRARCDNSGNWTLQGSMIVGAHEATGLVAQVPNLIYGTGSPPSVGSYAEGTLFIQYSP
jgi:hypothetical protein